MLTCRDVSMQLSHDDAGDGPWTRRLMLRLHLAMCRNCRAFARQLDAMRIASRQTSDNLERECPPSLERKIVDRLRRPD